MTTLQLTVALCDIAKHQITSKESALLFLCAGAPRGGVPLRTIAKAMRYPEPNVRSRAISLTHKRVLRRVDSQEYGEHPHYEPTEKGKEIIASAMAAAEKWRDK